MFQLATGHKTAIEHSLIFISYSSRIFPGAVLLCVSVCFQMTEPVFSIPHYGAVVNLEAHQPTFTPPPLLLLPQSQSWREKGKGCKRVKVAFYTCCLCTGLNMYAHTQTEHTPVITCSNSNSPSLFPAAPLMWHETMRKPARFYGTRQSY